MNTTLMPSTAQEVFLKLKEERCTLFIDSNDVLVVRGPFSALTGELAEVLRIHKPELVRILRCNRCGSTEFVDTPIHDGKSLRRDCAQCHRTLGFPVWYREG